MLLPCMIRAKASPIGRVMTIKFHLLDAMTEIPAQLKVDIVRELETANERIAHLIQLDRLDIVVAPEAWVIPEFGLCGYANGPGRITITLDPSSPRLHDPERPDRILGTLAHEMHHVARLRSGVETYTLGGRFVSEGLAQCFEEEGWCPNALLRGITRRPDNEENGRACPPAPVSERLRSRRLDVRPKGQSRVAAPCGILPGVCSGQGVAREQGAVGH